MKRNRLPVLGIAALLIALSLSGTSYAMSAKKATLFVDVPWLKANLSRVILLDARSEKAYKAGHLPGAIHSPWTAWTDKSIGRQGDPGWNVTMANDKLGAYVGSLGIDGKKPVIVYADPSGLAEDGRALWELRLVGIRKVKLLDGGFSAWKTAGGPVTEEVPAVKPVPFTVKKIDESYVIRRDDMIANWKKLQLVDARSTAEYAGDTDHGEKRRGHIPGAVSIPFDSVYNDDGTVMEPDQMRKLFLSRGVKPGEPVVTYCTIGIRSGFLAMMFRLAGWDGARNYEASFSEWAGNDNLPVEK